MAVAVPAATAPAALAAPSQVETALGRVVFATDGGVVHDNVDAGGGGHTIVLPDGSTLIVASAGDPGTVPRITITRLTATGAIDTTWGDRGTLVAPARLYVQQVLRQPDGRLLLVGTDRLSGLPGQGPAEFKVVRLLADGGLDPAFGDGGVATTSVGTGCGGCTTAAFGPDGSIVLTGASGTFPVDPTPTTVPDLRWVLTRLTPDGRIDASFGTNGVATIPDLKASGFNVAVLPGGQIVTEGQTVGSGFSADGVSIVLARLTPSGAMDPAFGDGKPVRTPLFGGFPMLVRDDGSIVVAGSQPGTTQPPFSTGRRLVAAYTASGTPDGAFAAGGLAYLASDVEVAQLLPAPAGGITVVATPGFSFQPGPRPPAASFFVGRWSATGPPAAGPFQATTVPFGGGGSSFLVSVRPRPLPPLGQNSFTGRRFTPRPAGGFLVVGGVSVTQPTGEGTGYSIGRTAIAALTPGLRLDPAYGGPAAPLGATVAVMAQRASTAYERHGIRVRLRATAPGLWRVKIRTRDGGRVLAQSVLPVFGTSSRTLPAELTVTGNRWLRTHRNVRVSVSVTARNLLGALATTTARGTLR